MADVVARLQVDSSQFDQRLKSAVEQMNKMEKEVRRTGASFAYADKEEIAFIRSLGNMETKTTSAKSQLREYTEALMQMTSTYRNLTQEEKNSDWGKALAASMEEIKGKAAMLRDAMADVNREIGGMASDTQVFDQIAGGVTGLVSVFQVGQGAMQMFGVKSDDAVQAIAKLQGAMAVANGLTKVQAMLQKESAVMIGIATVQKKAAAAAEAIDTAAKEKNIAVTKGAAIAQKALNAVANANPFLLLASAIGAVVAALAIFSSRASKAAEEQKKFAQSVGSSMGEMVSSYTLLKNQWEQLTTEQEKNDWIKNNADKFNELGVAINDVADAEKVFKDETAAMVKSFELRAKAAALQSLAEENYKKYYENAAGKERSEGQEITDMEAAKMHVLGGKGAYKEENGKFTLTKEGAALYNKTMFGDGKEEADAYLQSLQDINKELDDLYKNNGLNKAEGTNPIEVKVEPVIPEGSAAALKKQLSDLQKQWDMATSDKDRSGIQKQIDETQKALDKMNGKVENAVKVVEKASKPVEGSIAAQRESVNELQKAWENAADDESRAKIKEQLDAATESLNKMLGKTKEEAQPIEIPITFTEQGMSDLGKQIKDKMSKLDFGSADYLIAAENLVDFNTLQTLLNTAIKNGLDFDKEWFNSLFEDIKIGADVDKSQWQAVIDDINSQLAEKGIDPIKINLDTGSLEEAKTKVVETVDVMKESLDNLSSGIGAISTIGNAFNDLKGIGEDLADAFSGEMDAWDALMTVFNSGIGIMQTVMGVMEAINTLQALSTGLKKANTIATETEAATSVTAAATEAGAETTKAAANMTTAGTAAAASSAEAGEAVAGIPIVGPILAVAAIAAVLAATFAAMSKAKSAGSFATGGIVPGNNYNDGLTANVSSGELILNRAQQDSVASQLQGNNPFGNLALSMDLKGEDIQICLDNNRMRRGR